MVRDWRGWPEIGGVEGGIGGEIAGEATFGGDGATGTMAGDWRGLGGGGGGGGGRGGARERRGASGA
jgi:hypothetical protein